MENYRRILNAIMTNSQRLLQSLEEQSYIVQQIRANSLLIEADTKELAEISERIANLESTYMRLEVENQYYLSRTTMYGEIKKPTSPDYFKKLALMQSERTYLEQHIKRLKEENAELSEQIFHMKQGTEPEATTLRDAVDEYVRFGTLSSPEVIRSATAGEEESEASWKPE